MRKILGMLIRALPCCLAASTVLPASAMAGTVTGKVARLTTRASDGLQIVTIQGATSGKPACATYDYLIIRNEKSDAGKAQFAMLMAASLSGKSVIVDGAGTCARWGDGEDIEGVTYAP